MYKSIAGQRKIAAWTVEWMTLVGQHVNSSLTPPPIAANELQAVKAKVLLISGERDIFLPPSKLTEKTRQIFPDAQIVIVPDAGHLLPEEQPDIVLSHVRKFLA